MYEYSARLVRIVDADTLILDIDLGMHTWLHGQRIRAAGLNAPELATDAGRAALAWVRDWFTQHAPVGIITVRTEKDRNDNYGRLLGTILAPDGACLNTDMLAAGQALPWPRPAAEVKETTGA
ncbi:thermonuclease family protein [Streptomyces sp. NK08204]|uniref:thermonuclease family protein n=1 Tax=Streptomyces sp. NK08204 TaxID=2873260 RepID=UPI001CEC7C79|nr:thermonuclease family protein [Streptomyces sp. NK08204]